MAEKECWYVAARGGFNRDGSVRVALLAGPYGTRQEADRMVAPVSRWAAEHSGDQWAWFYEYGVMSLPPDLARSRLGSIAPDAGLFDQPADYRQVLAEAAKRAPGTTDKDRGPDR